MTQIEPVYSRLNWQRTSQHKWLTAFKRKSVFGCSAVNHGTKRPVNTAIKESLRHFVPAPRSRVIAADASFGVEGAPCPASG